jgi:hypothetical protein
VASIYFRMWYQFSLGRKYLKWRELIDKWLEETQKYATTPEECYRLMSGKPIEKGYRKAKKLIGPMPDKKPNAR